MKESTIEAIRYFMPGVIALISAGVITLTGWGVYEGCSSLYNTYEQYENRRTEWSKKHPSIEEYIDLNHDGIPDRMITTYDIDSLGDRHFFSRDITYCFRDTVDFERKGDPFTGKYDLTKPRYGEIHAIPGEWLRRGKDSTRYKSIEDSLDKTEKYK
jgi:hypothetical protein